MADEKTIKFEIVTPEKQVLKEAITQITVPTKSGEITILPNHIPLVASLTSGVIELVKSNGEKDIISVSGGFIEVAKNKIVILADTAERAEEIDVSRSEKAKQTAEESIKNIRQFDQEQFAGLGAKILKEMARSRAANKWKKIKSEKPN